MPVSDTIVAPATPAGESAIAVMRVSGPLCLVIATALRDGRPPLPWRVWHGDYTTHSGERIDEVMGAFFAGPKSYTGEDVLELSSHGNPFIVSKIVDDLRARGCRMANPGEFSQRAFLNGRIDLTSAEAVMDVIRARSDRALEFAQRQLHGEMQRRMERMADQLLGICAGIEAYIDFPEEDLPPEDRLARKAEAETLLVDMRRLRGSARCRTMLQEGPCVVLVGEPNVGKSTLFNRIAGSERAIVNETPGTTRDFIEIPVMLGPHRIRLVDTAGVRESPDAVERSGVERALEQADGAEIVILVVDAGRPSPALPGRLSNRLARGSGLVAINKSDLAVADAARTHAALGEKSVAVSALTGAGLDELLALLSSLTDEMTRTGRHDEGVVVNDRHAEALADAETCLAAAISSLGRGDSLELCASELRGAVDSVGRIVGRLDNEAMLDRLFSAFCIGK